MRTSDPHSGDGIVSEAPGAELDTLFDRARADGFTGSEAEELWGRVGAALAAPVAGGAPHGASGAGAGVGGGASAALKIAAALVVGGGLVAGAAAYRGRTQVPAPVVVVRAARPEVPMAPSGSVVPAPTVSIDALPRASDPTPVGTRSKPVTDRRDLARTPGGRAVGAGDTLDSTSAPAEALPAARTAAATGASLSDSTAGDGRGATASVPQSDPGPTEGALLLRARHELASDPSAALGLTQDHARRFPSGTLVQEREVLAIEALARLGRSAEARHRLDDFRARFPQSPHIARLASLIGP
jgi:hypothetical protein